MVEKLKRSKQIDLVHKPENVFRNRR